MSFVATAPAVPNPWARILGALEKKVNRQSFDTWLKPTRFSHITGRMLFVRVAAIDVVVCPVAAPAHPAWNSQSQFEGVVGA